MAAEPSRVGEGASEPVGTAAPRVLLLGRAGCHLCDVARELVDLVCAETDVEWDELDLADHPALADRYGDLVPVVLVDGVVHACYRVDRARLREALLS